MHAPFNPGSQLNTAVLRTLLPAQPSAAKPHCLILERFTVSPTLNNFCCVLRQASSQCSAQADAPAEAGGLRPDAFVDLKLIHKQQITHNSFALRLACMQLLPALSNTSSSSSLGMLPACQLAVPLCLLPPAKAIAVPAALERIRSILVASGRSW